MEALVYIAVFVMMSFIIVELIISILETNKQVSPLTSLSRGAVSSLEVMTREIRQSTSVDTVNSTFNTVNGALQLNTQDINGEPRVVRFYLDSGVVKINENGAYLGPLSSSDVHVNSLIINLATSTKQNLLKIELDMTAGVGKYQKNEKFHSSVGLRTDN